MYIPEIYRSRFVDDLIVQNMKVAAAVYISGPKWVGKTTSAEHYCLTRNGSAIAFDNSENGYEVKALAKIDPDLVLEGATPRLIDEWQECPALWDKIRKRADNSPKKGRYVLTGSFVDYDQYDHSGAGRIGEVKMDSMTLYETGDSSGKVSLSNLFEREKSGVSNSFKAISTNNVSLDDLIRFMVRGGWPASIDYSVEDAAIMPADYLSKIDKDVTELIKAKNKRNREKMNAILRVLAENDTEKILYTQILEKVNNNLEVTISKNTLYDYLDAFEKLNIIVNQDALIPSFKTSRNVFKSAKHRYTDSSLICAMLSLSRESFLSDESLREKLFDNLCFHDLRVYTTTALGGKVFHYADQYKLEIDCIVQMKDKRYGAFMNVLATDKIDAAAKELLKYKKAYEGTELEPTVLCVISGLSNAAYKREDGVYVVPLTALKP